jgi:hypothetical protein
MPQFATGANVLFGRGSLYFDRFTTAGVATGERLLGDVKDFSITPAAEVKDVYDYTKAATPLLVRVPIRVTTDVSMTLLEHTAANLALLVLGSDATGFTQTGGSITAEALNGTGVVLPALDRWYPLANRRISAVTVTGGAGGVTARATPADYTIDAEGGRIYITSTGACVAGTDLVRVTYTAAAISATPVEQVLAGTQATINGFMRFVSDPTSGPSWEVQCWKVNLTPDGSLSLITADAEGEFKLKGGLLADGVHADLFRMLRRP